MISVIIPLYNKETTIERALQSVLRQSKAADEIIVVDDGSTDHSLERVAATTHPSLRLVHQSNQGVSAARNRGITEAQGDYVAFLDADDEWHEEFLATMLHLLEQHPTCNVAASGYYKIFADGSKTQAVLNRVDLPDGHGMLTNYFEVATHSEPPINSSCIMVRTAALHAMGGFPIGIGQGEDLLTWARLAVANCIAYDTTPLSIFHVDQSSPLAIPKRSPRQHDVVGRELATLYHKHEETPGLKEYVAHWHKMRASMYLRLRGCNRQCRQEIALARQWNPHTKRMTFYSLLLLLPYTLRMNLLQRYHA